MPILNSLDSDLASPSITPGSFDEDPASFLPMLNFIGRDFFAEGRRRLIVGRAGSAGGTSFGFSSLSLRASSISSSTLRATVGIAGKEDAMMMPKLPIPSSREKHNALPAIRAPVSSNQRPEVLKNTDREQPAAYKSHHGGPLPAHKAPPCPYLKGKLVKIETWVSCFVEKPTKPHQDCKFSLS